MTEQEWFDSVNPIHMLWFLEKKASKRKLRLVACACCRRIWSLFAQSRSQQVIEAAEKVADQMPTTEDIYRLLEQIEGPREAINLLDTDQDLGEILDVDDEYSVARSALGPHDAIVRAAPAFAASYFECKGGIRAEESKRQTALVRDIFGNPFQPVTLEPHWRTAPVASLAEAIYTDRAFDRLPILADALEDAGCTQPDILEHCRGPGPHVRGCWVVDLLLGKE